MTRLDEQVSYLRWRHAVVCTAAATLLLGAAHDAFTQEAPLRFGGSYAELDARRQQFVNNWVARVTAVTGRKIEPETFYDQTLSLSTKTTFDAVTHALLTTPLTDRTGASLGDALALVAEVDTVRGEISGAAGDRQFRIYVRLTPEALGTLARSQEFKRGMDNSVYHKGYPTNYRGQGGIPSIQFSIALDGRRADVDVDYRSSSFPAGLFNGHLTSSNSDVRAGNNYNRHVNRWTGFQNWWNSIFGVRQSSTTSVEQPKETGVWKTPRIGNKQIDEMVHDFLTAWLIEGDSVAAMAYVSDRSYACLAQDLDNPADFDRGVAGIQLMANLKAASDALAPRTTLEGLTVGTRFVAPALRVVKQPYHPQFVIYSVPDDVAAAFDCESRLTLGDPKRVRRTYGNYFGATFYIDGQQAYPVALLWAREDGYWKIVSWKVGADDDGPPPAPGRDVAPEPKIERVNPDPSLVQAVRGFFDTWLIRKDYDGAFAYLSPLSYACYDLERDPEAAPSMSPDDAGRKLRAGMEALGNTIGTPRTLDTVMAAAEPVHPAIKVMNHQYGRVFSVTTVPNALGDAAECAARAAGSTLPDPLPLEYGSAFGSTVRFLTRSGDTPVLRLLWRREAGIWRITSYGIELP